MKTNMDMPDKIFGLDTDLFKLYLIPFPLVILCIISIGLVVMPKITNISEMNQQVKDLAKQTKEVDAKRKYLLNIDKKELTENAGNLQRAVLKDQEAFFLVGIIRKVCDKYGFQVKSFSINPGTYGEEESKSTSSPENDLKYIPLNVVIAGPKEKYIDTIYSLEHSLPILKINKFNMKSSTDISEFELNLSAIVLKDPEISNISKLSLNDLMLSSDEATVLKNIKSFEKIYGDESLKIGTGSGREYTKYERTNPFNL